MNCNIVDVILNSMTIIPCIGPNEIITYLGTNFNDEIMIDEVGIHTTNVSLTPLSLSICSDVMIYSSKKVRGSHEAYPSSSMKVEK